MKNLFVYSTCLLLSIFLITGLSAQNKISIATPNFSTTNSAGWKLNGSAVLLNNKVQLTNDGSQSASMFWNNKVTISRNFSFSTYFTFDIVRGLSSRVSYANSRADGIVFCIQQASNTAGGIGIGIGYNGIPGQSIGIEYDTWNNGGADDDDNHIALGINGTIHNMSSNLLGSQPWQGLGYTNEFPYRIRNQFMPVDLVDAQTKYNWIDYDGVNNVLEVRISNTPVRPSLPTMRITKINLKDIFTGSNDVFFGFTSATGGSYSFHNIQSIYLTTNYSPIDPIVPYIQTASNITVTKSNDISCPSQTSEISILAKKPDGSIASNEAIDLAVSSSNGVLSAYNVTTNASGIATVVLSNVTGGYIIVTATDRISGAYGSVGVSNSGTQLSGEVYGCVGKTNKLTGYGIARSINPWVSSDPTIASVDNVGNVTGLQNGKANITFTNATGCVVTAQYKVGINVTNGADLCQGTTNQLTGMGSTNSWVSSNYAIASIDGSGLVRASSTNSGPVKFTFKNAIGCLADTTISVLARPVGVPKISPILPVASTNNTVEITSPVAANFLYSKDGLNYQSSPIFSGLSLGNYTFIVKSINGCMDNDAIIYDLKLPADITVAQPGTYGQTCTTGTVTINSPYGGAPAWNELPSYMYSMDNGVTYQRANIFTGVQIGDKILLIKKANANTDTVKFTIADPAKIINQPSITSQSICINATPVTLSVNATASAGNYIQKYEWMQYPSGNVKVTHGSSAETDNFIPVTTTSEGPYKVYAKVTTTNPQNSYFCYVTSSNTGDITINNLPAITTHPSTTAVSNICLNTVSNPLSVSASPGSGTISYQWYKNAINSNTGGTLIIAATNSTYTPATSASGDTYYYVVVSNSGGCFKVSNVSGKYSVIDPINITIHPSSSSQTICAGTTPSQLSVTATTTIPSLSYQWYKNSGNNNTGGSAISLATGSAYTPIASSTASTYYYYVKVIANNCSYKYSDPSGALITDKATITGTLYVNSSSDPAVTLTGSGTSNGASPWASGNTSVVTINDLGIVTPVLSATGTSTITYTNSNSCVANSTFTVYSPISIATQPSTVGQTLCLRNTVTPLTVSASVSIGSIASYQWYKNSTSSNVSGGVAIAGTNAATYTPLSTISGTTYYYVKITTASGVIKYSDVSGAILINALPTPLVATATQTFCSATISAPTIDNLAFSSVSGTNSVIWYTALTGGAAITSTTSLINNNNYYVAQFDGTCESSRVISKALLVTTPASPTFVNATQVFCSINNPTVASLAATYSNTNTLKWFTTNTFGETALTSATLLINGNSYYASQTINTGSGCPSAISTPVLVTIYTTPALPSAGAQSFCSGNNPTVIDLVATATASNTVSWYTASSGGSALLSTTPIASGTYYVAQQNSAEGCFSNRTAVSVVSSPAAALLTTANTCIGQTLIASGMNGNTNALTWYNAGSDVSTITNANLRDTASVFASGNISGVKYVFVDANGYTFITRDNVHTVEKFAPGYIVGSGNGQVVAGTSSAGNAFTQLSNPQGIFVSASGDLYVADYGNFRVMKFANNNTTGTVVANTGTKRPISVFVDDAGTLYVGHLNSNGVDSYTAGSNSTTVGTLVANLRPFATAKGYPTNNNLSIYGLSVYNGDIYMSCAQLHAVYKFTAGVGTVIAGTTYSANTAANDYARLNTPMGIYVDATNGIYVTDQQNNRILKYPMASVSGTIGQLITGATCNRPSGIYKDPITNNLMVTNNGNSILHKFTKAAYYIPNTAGTYNFKYTNTSCLSAASNTITITDPFTINTQPSTVGQTLCVSSSVSALTISATSTGPTITYQWYSNTVNSTVGGTLITSATISSYTPQNTIAGSLYYYVKMTSGSCIKLSTVSGVIVINAKPTSLSASTQTFCSVNNPFPIITDLVLTGVTGTNTLNWYTASVGGAAISNTTLLVNNTSYYASQTNGTCEGARAAVLAYVVTTPSAPTVLSTQSFCGTSSNTVSTLVATGTGSNTIKWYLSSLGGTALLGSALLVDGNTYYASQTVTTGAGCESALSTATTITLIPNVAPILVITNPAPVCAPATVNLTDALITTGSPAGLTYTYFTDALATTTLSPSTAVSNGGTYSKTYYIKGSSGCNTSISPVVVSISTVPVLTSTAVNALSFDGVDDNITTNIAQNTVANTFTTNKISFDKSDFTVEAWLNITTSTNQNQAVFSLTDGSGFLNNERAFYLDTDGKPAIYVYSPANKQFSTLSIKDGTWHHVAWVWDYTTAETGTLSILIDGVVRTNTTSLFYKASGNATTSPTFRIGKGALFEAVNYFKGSMRDVRIWQVARTPTEIIANKDKFLEGPQTGLVANYKFNQGTAGEANGGLTSLIDNSGNGNNGTLTGFDLAGSSSNWTSTSSSSGGTFSTTAQTVCIGSTASQMSISTSDIGISYKWFKTLVNANSNGTEILGATASTFTPSETTPGIYYYYVVGTNTSGCSSSSDISNAITFRASVDASITSISSLGFTCSTTAINLTAITSATSTPTYQWQLSTNSGTSWANVGTGGTTQVYSATTAGQYKVIIASNGCSGTSASTTILAAPSASAASTSVCAGLSTTFTVNATGYTSPTYQWQIGSGTGSPTTWTNIDAATSQTYAANSAGQYKVVVASTNNSTVATCPITLTVNTLPTATVTISSASICAGTSATFTSTSGALTPTYQWQINTGTITNTTWGNITGATSSTYSTSNAGKYSLLVRDGNGCTVNTDPLDLAISDSNTITLSSAAGTNSQTICINNAITNITYTTTSATGATVTGLPTGLTYGWATNSLTISGTATVAGVYNYIITLTGGCANVTAKGTIGVTAANTVTLNSVTGTNSQIVCMNSPINFITYKTVGATNVTVADLPTGLTSNWSSNVLTISGTPSASGTFTYTVNLTGGCGTIGATGTLLVNPNKTSVLSSATGSDAQTICVNNSIAAITYATTGTSSATITGLPTGLIGTWASNVVTISGTPTVSGTYSYTVTLTTGCGTVSNTGSVVVTPENSITLSSVAGTDTQTICINTAIDNITYSTTGAISANVSGLPAGLTGVWLNNVFTISGTPMVSGIFNYTVTLSGGCGTMSGTNSYGITKSGVITILALPSQPITTLTDPTCIVASGSIAFNTPIGVAYSYSLDQLEYQTSPTFNTVQPGTYSIVVKNTGGCVSASLNVTINTQPLIPAIPTISNAGANTVCAGTLVTLTSSTGDNYQWYHNGTIIPGANNQNFSTSLSKNLTVVVTNNSGCSSTSSATVVTVNAVPTASIQEGTTLAFNNCEDTKVALTASTNAGTISITYQWLLDAQDILGATASTFEAKQIGKYSVSISNDGCTTISAFTKILAIPSVSNIGSNSVCAGGLVPINVSSVGFITPTYQWKIKPDGLNDFQDITLGGNSSTYSATISGDYIVEVVDNNISSSTSCPTKVIVNALPIVSISTLSSSSICAGSNITLLSNSIGGTGTISNTNINSFQWQTSATDIQGEINDTYSTAISGDFALKVTDNNGCVATSATNIVSVSEVPTFTITNPASVCSPASVDITLTIASSSTTLTYSYFNDNFGTSIVSNPYSVTTAGDYYIKGTTSTGCVSALQKVQVAVMVPTIVITNPVAVCAPNTVNLTSSDITNGSTNGLLYSYYTDALATSILSNASVLTNSGVYFIKSENGGGCISINPVTVIVKNLPNVIINNPAAVCFPNTINLTSSAITEGSDIGLLNTYYADALATRSLINSGNISNSGNYYLKSLGVNGCDVMNTIQVAVNTLPVVVITNPAAVCLPNTVDLTADAILTGSSPNLVRSFYTDPSARNYLSYPEAVSKSGSYYIQSTNSDGCNSTNEVVVVLNSLPTINSITNIELCNFSTFNATKFTSQQIGTKYSWINSNSTIGIGNNGIGDIPSFTATNSSIVSVDAVFSITPSLNGCDGPSIDVVCTVKPTSVIGNGCFIDLGNSLTNDTDGDGVKDMDEIIDGTILTDPCSYKLTSQSVAPNSLWLNNDCNGDGIANGEVVLLSKYASNPILNGDGTVDLKYTLLLRNLRPEKISNIKLLDDLNKVFDKVSEFKVISTLASGSLSKNNDYDGSIENELLMSSSYLEGYAKDSVVTYIHLVPKSFSGKIYNIAQLTALAKFGSITKESIDTVISNGRVTGPPVATSTNIPELALSIPQGFSPNRDGISDYFRIVKSYNVTIQLEIINRWGMTVYSSNDYKNDWDGKGPNSLLGKDLVDGGYFYTAKAIDKNGIFQIYKGFVLIQR